MKIIIFGKRKRDSDGFEEDMDLLGRMTERSVVEPTRFEPPGKKLRIITTNTVTAVAANPEPGSSNEVKPEPAKETLREKWRRLRTEVKNLEKVNDGKKET